MDKTKCEKCKSGYIIDNVDYHPLCAAGHCYLCNKYGIDCDDFEEGEVPEYIEEINRI